MTHNLHRPPKRKNVTFPSGSPHAQWCSGHAGSDRVWCRPEGPGRGCPLSTPAQRQHSVPHHRGRQWGATRLFQHFVGEGLDSCHVLLARVGRNSSVISERASQLVRILDAQLPVLNTPANAMPAMEASTSDKVGDEFEATDAGATDAPPLEAVPVNIQSVDADPVADCPETHEPTAIKRKLATILKSLPPTDMCVMIGPEPWPLHRFVLAHQSPFWRKAIYPPDQPPEDTLDIVLPPDASAEAAVLAIMLIYTAVVGMPRAQSTQALSVTEVVRVCPLVAA